MEGGKGREDKEEIEARGGRDRGRQGGRGERWMEEGKKEVRTEERE